ncbi:M14 family zinc carboxypeptidase, partial [Clostridium algidicarnis]
MGKYYPNVNPGEIVPGGFTYPNNAKLQGDFLYLRDANKHMVSGRQVDEGDSITVLDVGYSQQLALVQYPTSAGVRQGYVNNTPSVIKYNDANAWANGSTTETVYDENGGQLGSLDPYEKATPLYKKDGMTHVVYNTDKGSNTKSGYVKYEGTGGSTSPGGEIKPGELVPGGFTYPNNAKLQGDFLYLRDANKNMVSGRQVDDGDSITVLDVGYSQQLALVQYPTSAGVRQGYINNTPSVIKYNDANAWANGSTTEIVYDENGGQLGSLSPYESATPLYRKNGMTHVVYNTDKGPNTKSGYVKYEGGFGFNDSNIEIPPISHLQAIKEQYGISGKGRPLNVYKIGNGSKVLFAGFALHGWEDNWDNDGIALVNIANSLITRLGDYKSQNNGLHGWTVYIAPCMNPDGVIIRGTKDGPGRCAVTSRIDMNRCFPYNFTPQYSSRNYTGANSLGAPEAKAIKSYLEKINSSSTEMIVLDFHGWMNFTQGNAEIGRYFGS